MIATQQNWGNLKKYNLDSILILLNHLGTPWCVVWTGDGRSFFYNPTTKTSVWEKPPEMIGRADVAKMLESAEVDR